MHPELRGASTILGGKVVHLDRTLLMVSEKRGRGPARTGPNRGGGYRQCLIYGLAR